MALPGIASRKLIFWPWLLVGGAWGLALLAAWTHQSYLINHDYLLQESGLPWFAALLLFLVCWQVMTAAMMLPSSLPQMLRLAQNSRLPPYRLHRIGAAFLGGYAAVWTGFAAAAFLGDTAVHQLVAVWPWLTQHVWVIGSGTLALAGVYQISPLKQRALMACRLAISPPLRTNPLDVGIAGVLGWQHGKCCVASCWALMLVMFGIGVGGLLWMAALAVVMLIEKVMPGGRWFSPVVGLGLLFLAALWAFDAPGLLLVTGG